MQLSSEGAVGVPLKFELVRGRRVVEQRRTRLLCPSLEDVKRCVRQWACGVFTLRYVDDEGDLVTVYRDEEWAECVALWREARGADDADVCDEHRALRLVVTIGAQDGSAVCLGQQRHLLQAFWDGCWSGWLLGWQLVLLWGFLWALQWALPLAQLSG